jgi:hypothetical protein
MHECNFSWLLDPGCQEYLITVCKLWLKRIRVTTFDVDFAVLHPLYTVNWKGSCPGRSTASFVQAFSQQNATIA